MSKNEINRRRQWISEAEEKILELESAKETALREMGSPGLDNDRRLELANQCAAVDMDLEKVFAEWEKWSLEIEQGAAAESSTNNTE